MMGTRKALWKNGGALGVLVCSVLGCGAGMEEEPCVALASTVRACFGDRDPDHWFPPVDGEIKTAEEVVELSCVVESSGLFGRSGIRLVLSECVEEGEAASERVVFEIDAVTMIRKTAHVVS